MEKARFVRTTVEGNICWGVIEGDVVYRLDGSPLGKWTRGEPIGNPENLALLAPATPTKIVCVGRNYAAHAAEHKAEVPTEPLLFFKPPSSVIGPGAPIVLTPQSKQVEHESELVVVIGRRCRNVSADEAWGYVLGVTCGNDVTARDLQRQDSQWTRAKGFDTFCPLGPWLVTGLSESEVANLEVTCRVNGQVRQRGSTSEMVFPPAQLIAYISAIMTLEPGDAIMTGTPAGVSPIVAGDEVEVEVESVGILKNPVTW
ncbi:MAG: fumarylacetoacetate hydrolase family protein [Anaerolineae bacterium]|jgi:2-keto-4-pentenoate hydratase/2-oxohepta-3-ene-1,7-dioic acid hydratase in catechol pathway